MPTKPKTKPFIPMAEGLRQTRQVRQMALTLDRSRAEVCGYLLFVWEYANRELGPVSNRVEFTRESDIDDLTCPGFAKAMAASGWLAIGETWVEFCGYNDEGAYGSWAKHQADRTRRLAPANARRALSKLNGAKRSQANPTNSPPLVTNPVTTTPASLVTNPNGNGNGNGNGNKNVFVSSLIPVPPPEPTPQNAPEPQTQKTNISLSQSNPKPQPPSQTPVISPEKRVPPLDPWAPPTEKRAALDAIARGAPESIRETWELWIRHCEELNKLPTQSQANADFGRLGRMGSKEAQGLIQTAIQRRRYTLEFPSSITDSGSLQASPPPRQEGQKRLEWNESRATWTGCSCLDRELIWNPTSRRWHDTGMPWTPKTNPALAK